MYVHSYLSPFIYTHTHMGDVCTCECERTHTHTNRYVQDIAVCMYMFVFNVFTEVTFVYVCIYACIHSCICIRARGLSHLIELTSIL